MPLSGDDHLQWLSHLSQLELDWSAANLSNALHWLQVDPLEDNPLSSLLPDEIGNLKISILGRIDNKLNGSFPESLGNLSKLEKKSSIRRAFSAWMQWTSLILLRLENNNLTGNISSSMGFLRAIQSFHLRNNSLSGKFLQVYKIGHVLRTIDLGQDEFTEKIPVWMGKGLPDLLFLAFVQINSTV
ncbi:hypothetical protein GIB67_020425, partial [Kingdonia uniflora]